VSGTPIGIVDTDVGPLIAPIDPWIWPDLAATGRWEPMVGDVVRSILRPGDVVVNVGAHVGYYTLMASHAVGDTGLVVAYEPVPSNRALLRLNTTGSGNVVVRDAAVSDAAGDGFMSLSGINPGDHRLGDTSNDSTGTTPVKVVALDDDLAFRPGPLRLVFTDAQGADLRVLRGARRLIDRHQPHVIIEWTPHMLDHGDYPEIDRLLDAGYTASLIEGPHIVINRAIDGDVIGQGTATMHLSPHPVGEPPLNVS
jgi:FkbM family methyltransferase